MKLLVQEYLKSGGSYESLEKDHGVYAKPYNGKVSFAYDQIVAKTDDELANQCRGLILRENTWEALAIPMFRFYNFGQGCAAEIDWNTARFENKMDGSLSIIYNFENHWYGATRQMCEAQGNVDGVGTFAELIDKTAQTHGAKNIDSLMRERKANKDVTYCFELTSPYNKIVCHYDTPSLTLLACRSLITGNELDPKDEAEKLGVPIPKAWHFNNIEHLIEVMRDWHPKDYEGVVVKDNQFRRIKVKTPQYLAAHHARDSLGVSWRAVCEAVAAGFSDDIYSLVPDYVQKRIDTVKDCLAIIIQESEKDYTEIKDIDDMKTYAFAANVKRWPSALFALKRKKTDSVSEFAKKTNPDSILSLVQKINPDIK